MSLLDAIAAEAGTVFSREFAEVAVYTPAGGDARRVPVIFDLQSDVQEIGELLSHDGNEAFVSVETAALPEVQHNDTIEVRGNTYRVVGVEPDGTGRSMIILGE